MAEAILTRMGPNAWTLDGEDEQLCRVKIGAKVRVKWSLMRNYEFHKKYFALLDTAFDWWEPHATYKGQPIAKNKERFRKDVQILAGYGYPVVTVDGDVRMESESISFGSMTQERFEQIYNAVLQVILDKVLSREDAVRLDEAVNSIMAFA